MKQFSTTHAALGGTFRKVTAKPLALYVDEFEFRHINRMQLDIFGAAVATV